MSSIKKISKRPGFKPVKLKITITSARHLELLKCIFNASDTAMAVFANSHITDGAMEFDGDETMGFFNECNIYNALVS